MHYESLCNSTRFRGRHRIGSRNTLASSITCISYYLVFLQKPWSGYRVHYTLCCYAKQWTEFGCTLLWISRGRIQFYGYPGECCEYVGYVHADGKVGINKMSYVNRGRERASRFGKECVANEVTVTVVLFLMQKIYFLSLFHF